MYRDEQNDDMGILTYKSLCMLNLVVVASPKGNQFKYLKCRYFLIMVTHVKPTLR